MRNRLQRRMEHGFAFHERMGTEGIISGGVTAFYAIEMHGHESDMEKVERKIKDVGSNISIVPVSYGFFSSKKVIFYYGEQLLPEFLRKHKVIKKFLCVTKVWFNTWDEHHTDARTAVAKFSKVLKSFDVDFTEAGDLYGSWTHNFLGCRICMSISAVKEFWRIIEFQKITELPNKSNICYEGAELVI